MSWVNDFLDAITNRQFHINAGDKDRKAIRLAENERTESVERLWSVPTRHRGSVDTSNHLSLLALLKELDPDEKARLYVTRNGAVNAILNDHTWTTPGWRDFVIGYSPQLSESWVAWSSIQNRMRAQLETAEFIEERIKDFARPTGAQMLELATNFDVARSGRFLSALRLGTGEVQFAYEQQDKARGNIKVPTSVELGMRVFDGLGAYKFPALFRYRIDDGKLTMGFKIENAQAILEQAVNDLEKELVKGAGKRLIVRVASLPARTDPIV